MRFSEFRRWLEARGVIFKPGKKHFKLYLGDRRSTFPRHQSQEVGETLRKLVLRQLGLD
jgi:mRNA interferase HicA